MRVAGVLLIAAAPATAEPVTAQTFAAHVEGRTVAFETSDGTFFGAERYLPGGEVLWSTGPGDCLTGRWSEIGGRICFFYEGREGAACWTVELQADRLVSFSAESGLVVFERRGPAALDCDVPELLSLYRR